ncbi:hypothetical protein IAQ61_011900 [Plenodomus lingam]|uniref:Predicted protein n=1 Tax=Leptosphaeria maculans (strain JN3 / isolate v23.1.3 / race Av1-4-5-6-7-8) TaxID=985895 RepID=E5ABG0_LEPMJ|nr:predicted protein [Plenodomus lingam JN3]KAH9860116.1 hypothetical protein IAQ61_011900 [Plenodomus lingam]CBY01001.1 predicted protein [Plenodomus lingam JN3]
MFSEARPHHAKLSQCHRNPKIAIAPSSHHQAKPSEEQRIVNKSTLVLAMQQSIRRGGRRMAIEPDLVESVCDESPPCRSHCSPNVGRLKKITPGNQFEKFFTNPPRPCMSFPPAVRHSDYLRVWSCSIDRLVYVHLPHHPPPSISTSLSNPGDQEGKLLRALGTWEEGEGEGEEGFIYCTRACAQTPSHGLTRATAR